MTGHFTLSLHRFPRRTLEYHGRAPGKEDVFRGSDLSLTKGSEAHLHTYAERHPQRRRHRRCSRGASLVHPLRGSVSRNQSGGQGPSYLLQPMVPSLRSSCLLGLSGGRRSQVCRRDLHRHRVLAAIDLFSIKQRLPNPLRKHHTTPPSSSCSELAVFVGILGTGRN